MVFQFCGVGVLMCRAGSYPHIVRNWIWSPLGVVWTMGWAGHSALRADYARGRLYLSNQLGEGQ